MKAMREIIVFVGVGLDAEAIQDELNYSDEDGQENTSLHDVAHALMAGQKDDRTEIHSVGVDTVTIDPAYPTQVHLVFTASWSACYGCRDLNEAGDRQLFSTATYTEDGHLNFQVPEPRRPANHC